MDVATAPAPELASTKKPWFRRKQVVRAVEIVVSLGLVVGIFAGILPKIADYSAVWQTITALTSLELASLILVTALHILTYWPQMMASMPGLTFWQAGVNNQSSTTIANTLPLGGALATGVSFTMYRSWGFRNSEIVLSVLVTGVWNTFIKLATPVLALVALAVTGQATGAFLLPTLIGIGLLVVAVVMLVMTLHSRELARRVGSGIGRLVSFFRRLVRKPAVEWGDAAMQFRQETVELVAKQWVALTLSTLLSQACLYLVLLLCLRHVGVTGQEVSWAQALGVFAFVRLISAAPITPGGVGLVELGYIGALFVAGKDSTVVPLGEFKIQIAAAVLLFRTLTYAAQIPLGLITYVVWRSKTSWQQPRHRPVTAPVVLARLEPVASPQV
jgi:uncharacterized membrane protein YbhN (UPF0104 family)